jgi:hypothetical protein
LQQKFLFENRNKELCINLACADSEKEVIQILKDFKYWDNEKYWNYYGDNENNFATIGNQQSRPEAALVEKIINSVDAVLMAECLKRGIDPESRSAPQSIQLALEKYFNIYNGKLSNITSTERTKIAGMIALVATGRKTNPCYSIIDKGEGQTPVKMPDTLLSIGKSNKLRIPFVQGKFNMGGTGVFQFCGENNLQLVISKRHREIQKFEKDDTKDLWGFTIIRRSNPEKGMRSSSYKYLAPNGKILTIDSDTLPLLPGEYSETYKKPIEYGTFIKLYEYQMGGLKTNILFDLYNKISLLLPSIALPIRFYERRKGYSGHSLETTLSGLAVRLDEDKRENLETGFPDSSTILVNRQRMNVSIYVFKRGQSTKYSDSEGIIFTINGQTHGYLSKSFFSRQSVKMNYLADSILVLVDCSNFDSRSREDLFMNSRDRLRSGDLRANIISELEELLRNHTGLKELRERRRREDIENKLEDSKPLADIIENILKKSPTLSKLFIDGVRISNPFKVKKTKAQEVFKGEKYPSFFKLIKEYPYNHPKLTPKNVKLRIQYKTNVENEYFNRDSDPGNFSLSFNGHEYADFSINLWNGIATLNVQLPEKLNIGDIHCFSSKVNDISLLEPFEENFFIKLDKDIGKKPSVPGKRKPPSSDKDGEDIEDSSRLDLPDIREVREDEWHKYDFDKYTSLVVRESGENEFTFFINMDNVHLKTESKSNTDKDSRLLGARYKYGMALIGIAMLKERNNSNEDAGLDNNSEDIFSRIKNVTKTISPILLPMISGLGDLKEDITEDSDDDLQS